MLVVLQPSIWFWKGSTALRIPTPTVRQTRLRFAYDQANVPCNYHDDRTLHRRDHKNHEFLGKAVGLSFLPTSTCAFLSKKSYLDADSNKETKIRELIECIRKAQTAMELDQILYQITESLSVEQAKSTSPSFRQETTSNDNTSIKSNSNKLQHVSLNITAAALRRAAHITVMESRLEKQQAMSSLVKIDKTTPIKLRQLLLEALLDAVGTAVVSAKREQQSTNERIAPSALVDTLEALAILSQRTKEARSTMQPLVRVVVGLLSARSQEEIDSLGPIRIVQCLQALSTLQLLAADNSNKKKSNNNNNTDNESSSKSNNSIEPVVQLQRFIYNRLTKPDAVSQVHPQYLSYGLNSLARIVSDCNQTINDKDANTHSTSIPIEDSMVLARIFWRRLKRLRQKATVSDLCRGLVGVTNLVDVTMFGNNYQQETASGGDHQPRRRSFRESTISSLPASSKLPGGLSTSEITVFGYTCIQEIIKKVSYNEQKGSLTMDQVLDILSSWIVLRRDGTGSDEIMDDLFAICENEQILQNATIWELERLTSLIEQLQATKYGNIMKLAGERLLEIVKENHQLRHQIADRSENELQEATTEKRNFVRMRENVSPRTISSILRCPVLLYRRDEIVLRSYIEVSEQLFVDIEFLSKSWASELSNFLWFMSITKRYNDEALIALARRILDPDVVDTCSPKLSCRILGTFTAILSAKEQQIRKEQNTTYQQEVLSQLLRELFHGLGGNLLVSSQLSPSEVSSALYAYAKASYARDMGIFDHLVALMAAYDSSQCTVRQLAQSLWSCGKMMEWERTEKLLDNDGAGQKAMDSEDQEEPPFHKHAQILAEALSSRSSELCSIDVAQCIWALGRLRMTEAIVVCSFAYRAMELLPNMNSAEVANCLWGLGKVKFNDLVLLEDLAERMTAQSCYSTPQEAAIALYTLGSTHKNVRRASSKNKRFEKSERTRKLFADLSNIILQEIDQASSQAVANTLWAHNAATLPAPQKLLDSWATRKLGLVGVQKKLPSESLAEK